jgi:phenylalanyl-tRNA synthetase beta chain
MKLSTLWLQEMVHFKLTEQELADQLTMAGLEVDSISPVAGAFSKVVVAEVLHATPHPNADKLTLCDVRVDADTVLKIVCGASNVRTGLKVALAMIGAELPGNFKIKESKLRGELSQGMLCSLSELGMAEQSEGIMELLPDAPIGMDIRDYLTLDDSIIDVDLTPNRADCFSVLGIAREVAARNILPLIERPVTTILPVLDDVLPVMSQASHACPKYCARIIRNINLNALTPSWMSERLRRSGIRIVHPVVDVLNYVMLELGQPMHAFDCATIQGEINVRFAKNGESLVLLDKQTIQLNDSVLVIADRQTPLALAGIMGGAHSAVVADTKDIFLESAYFNPLIIAGVARAHSLFSDSSQRFERGVDPYIQQKALERATDLILSISGGEPGPIIEFCDTSHIPKPLTVHFNTEQVAKITGLTIAFCDTEALLQRLGFVVLERQEPWLLLQVPTYRFDVAEGVDLVEEVIRLYGYDKLKAESINAGVGSSITSSNEALATFLSSWFCGRGYHETISYSFVDPELHMALYPEQQCMKLINPISFELSQMRIGMWPGLIASMIYNLHRQHTSIQLFELGVVFEVVADKLSERACIAGLLAGDTGSLNWSYPTRVFDFYDLKGDLQALCAQLKLKDVVFQAAQHPALHPGQSARIMINQTEAGWIGVLHPQLMDELSLQHDVIVFELNMSALTKADSTRYKSISKYPKIRRDLSFLVDEGVCAYDIERTIRSIEQEGWLKDCSVFDVYVGAGVPVGKKSLAVALTLQDDKRTLVDLEITTLIAAILKTLEHKYSILLRE